MSLVLSTSPNLSTAYNLLLSSTVPDTSPPTTPPIHEEPPRLPQIPADDSPTKRMNFGNIPSATLIASLESYINPAVPVGTSLSTDATAPALHIIPSPTLAKLKNLGPARVKDMRNLGHSKQVVSHVPIAANLATCVKFNDALYTAIQMNMEKFVALALLPGDGKDAAKELQRCVTKMKFVGGVVGARSLDAAALLDSGYEELWATAEKYRVPIALRELWPTGAEVRCLTFLQRQKGSTDISSSQPTNPPSQTPSSHR